MEVGSKVLDNSECRFEIKFSLSKEAYQKLREATTKLSNKLGSDLSVEGVVTELLNQFTEESKPRNREVLNTNSRYIKDLMNFDSLKALQVN